MIYYEKPDNKELFGISSTLVRVSKPNDVESKMKDTSLCPISAFPDELFFHYKEDEKNYDVSYLNWTPLYTENEVEEYKDFFNRMSITENLSADERWDQIEAVPFYIGYIQDRMEFYSRVAVPMSEAGFQTETITYHLDRKTLEINKSVSVIEPATLVSLATQDWTQIYNINGPTLKIVQHYFYTGLLEDKTLMVGYNKTEKPSELYYVLLTIRPYTSYLWMKASRAYCEALHSLDKIGLTIYTKEGTAVDWFSKHEDEDYDPEVPF